MRGLNEMSDPRSDSDFTWISKPNCKKEPDWSKAQFDPGLYLNSSPARRGLGLNHTIGRDEWASNEKNGIVKLPGPNLIFLYAYDIEGRASI